MEIIERATLQQHITNTPDSYLRPLLAALYLEDQDCQSPGSISVLRFYLTHLSPAVSVRNSIHRYHLTVLLFP